MKALRRIASTAVSATLFATALAVIPASPAAAACYRATLVNAPVTLTVCAQDLYVRTQPGGAFNGTLYHGQRFRAHDRRDGYIYGYAYGDVQRWGWVIDGWFYRP